jgi:hypothetical protein
MENPTFTIKSPSFNAPRREASGASNDSGLHSSKRWRQPRPDHLKFWKNEKA